MEKMLKSFLLMIIVVSNSFAETKTIKEVSLYPSSSGAGSRMLTARDVSGQDSIRCAIGDPYILKFDLINAKKKVSVKLNGNIAVVDFSMRNIDVSEQRLISEARGLVLVGDDDDVIGMSMDKAIRIGEVLRVTFLANFDRHGVFSKIISEVDQPKSVRERPIIQAWLVAIIGIILIVFIWVVISIRKKRRANN